MLKLWLKTFGKEFYKQHAGLLLIIFYLLFGWMQSGGIFNYVLSILLTLCSSFTALLGFCFFLSLYGLKCLVFISQKLSALDYTFVNISCSAKKKTQLKNWLGLYCILLFPALLFAVLILITSLYYHYYWSAIIISSCVILLLGGLTLYTFRKVNYGFKPFQSLSANWLTVKKPYWTWTIHYVLKKQILMFVICKVLSFIVFTGIIWMFADSGNDIRVYLIALLASVIAHSTLIAAVLRFERSSLAFLNSLPIGQCAKLLNNILFLVLLFAPEFILYSIKASLSVIGAASAFLFSIVTLLTLRMSLYILGDNMDSYLKFIFCFFLAGMFAILTNQYLILSLILLICNMAYHSYLFYRSKL